MGKPTLLIYLFNIREGLGLPGRDAGTGGVPTQMATVVRKLAERGNVDVVLVTNEHFSLPGARVRRVPALMWHPRIVRLLRPVVEYSYRYLYRGGTTEKVALFPIDMPHAQVRAARAAGCRVVGWVNADSVVDRTAISKSMEWVAEYQDGLAHADQVLTLTANQAELARERWGGSPMVVHGGAPEFPESLLGTAQEYALWVGRMVPAKRPELFLQLARCMPDRRFVMVASIAPWDSLGADYLAHESARTPNLTVLTNVSITDMPSIYAAARVLVLSSASEGLPRVVLEAAACGVETASLELDPDGMLGTAGLGIACGGDFEALVDAVRARLGNPPDLVRRHEIRARVLSRYPLSETVAAIESLVVESSPR